jgi:hypothetical protein
VADFLLAVVNESKENFMNSRIRIVKRNESSEPKPASTDGKTMEVLRNRETVAVVKSWIDEFKLRSRQGPRVALPLPNKA